MAVALVARVLGFGLADLKACTPTELLMWVETARACLPPSPGDMPDE